MVMFKAKFKPVAASDTPQPIPPQPNRQPQVPPIEDERGPRVPVREPEPRHEPERVG